MINIDKTNIEKDELELWEEITKGDKKYKKSNYLKSAKIIKKSNTLNKTIVYYDSFK